MLPGSEPTHLRRESHLPEALANKAIDEGTKVSWFTPESLTAHLGRATVDNTVSKAVAKITRCDLIFVDDIGMLPLGRPLPKRSTA
nr:ATP-binding protein [Streptomyces sp. NRRL F-4428]